MSQAKTVLLNKLSNPANSTAPMIFPVPGSMGVRLYMPNIPICHKAPMKRAMMVKNRTKNIVIYIILMLPTSLKLINAALQKNRETQK